VCIAVQSVHKTLTFILPPHLHVGLQRGYKVRNCRTSLRTELCNCSRIFRSLPNVETYFKRLLCRGQSGDWFPADEAIFSFSLSVVFSFRPQLTWTSTSTKWNFTIPVFWTNLEICGFLVLRNFLLRLRLSSDNVTVAFVDLKIIIIPSI